MSEFLDLTLPSDALNLILEKISFIPEEETIPTSMALGRVTSRDVFAPHRMPSFSRSAMDGFAVQAKDTFGASETAPAYLPVVGEVPMGANVDFTVESGECALIHTGGMLPSGADAVVMMEYTQMVKDEEVEIYRAAAVGEHIVHAGEDFEAGQVAIAAGVVLRPVEIGGLMAFGITSVQVTRRLRVGILSSGDEVVPPDRDIKPGQVRDINSYSLAALVQQAGADASLLGIIPDKEDALFEAVNAAVEKFDLVLITAGSSASTRDLTARVIDRLGPPGVLVHGINVRPGKPTIFGICQGKPVVGLPGQPLSAMIIGWLLVNPILKKMRGISQAAIKPTVKARMSANVPSMAGREDWIPVLLSEDESGYIAQPIFFKSNLIFNLARANGLVSIPADQTGLHAGEIVEAYLYQ
ncbi:MAG: molybdopterin molybdenumtransferase MoeA [Anaerolineales bacterium]|nr:molybdopterin molybdenumtransferase MoeA [Anaerolineales bacterium]